MGLLTRIASDARIAAALTRVARIAPLKPDAPTTYADRFEERVQAQPERVALIQGDRELSYGEVDAAANRFARWAASQGVGRGDAVALLLGNRPELPIAWLGLAKLGAVAALINHHLRGGALAHCIDVAKARFTVLNGEFAEAWESARPRLSGGSRAFVWHGEAAGAEPLDEALAERSPAPLPENTRKGLTAGDLFLYIYTSGTTGLPKAARISHMRAMAIGSGAVAGLGLGPDDRMYDPLPLYHSAGGAMALGGSLLAGASVIIAPRFSASSFWSDCVEHGATTFQYIGELCRYLLNSPEHPDERSHNIRACIGNGLRPEVWEPFQERFAIPKIVEFYGATEGNVPLMNYDGKVGAVGRLPIWMRRPLGVHLVRYDVERDEHVRNEKGFCVPCGPDEPGEAIGRISKVARFEGYSDAKATQKKVLHDVFEKGDTYFRTGDLLRYDRDGYFYFVDRIGDTFRWKGENVSTGEVAEVLSRALGVREANVYGVEVPEQEGRAGMAALVLEGDLDPAALYSHLEEELPVYARPLFLRIQPEMETTGTFKHRKVDLVGDGFDPGRVSDPLWFRDAEAKRYVPLDAALHARLAAGEVRL